MFEWLVFLETNKKPFHGHVQLEIRGGQIGQQNRLDRWPVHGDSLLVSIQGVQKVAIAKENVALFGLLDFFLEMNEKRRTSSFNASNFSCRFATFATRLACRADNLC